MIPSVSRPALGGLSLMVMALTLAVSAPGCRDTPPSPAELVRRGDELAEKKQYTQAIAAYRTAVRSNPKDGETRLKLANAYLSAGQWTDAAPEAIRAADLLPDHDAAQKFAIEMLLAEGRFVDALDRVTERLKDRPKDAGLLVLLGNSKAHFSNSWFALSKLEEALRLGHNYDEALTEVRPRITSADRADIAGIFRRAVDAEPNSVAAQLALANFSWAVGQPEAAEEALQRAARQNDILANRALAQYYLRKHRNAEGEKHLKVATSLGDGDAQLALADYYIATNRDSDARAVLKSRPSADDASGTVSLRMASVEFRGGNRDQAVAVVEQVLARQPRNEAALLLKTQILFAGKQWDQAMRAARATLEQNPKSSEAHAILGQILAATGNLEDAFAELSEAVRLRPDADDLPLPLAQLSLRLDRNEDALAFAREAKRRHPDDPQASLALVKSLVRTHDYRGANLELRPLLVGTPSPDVLVQLGTVQAALNNSSAARAAFTRALASDNQSLDALAGLVSLDLKAGRLAAARQLVDQSLTSHANNPGYLMLAAKVYGAQNDTARTQQALQQVLAIDPTNVGAAIWLADELGRQHQSDAARKVLEQLLEHRPQSVEADTALARRLELDGQIDEARKRYEKIVALNPEAAQAAQRLAAIYVAQTRNLDVALNHASTAKRLLPHDPDVMDTLGWVYVAKNQWPQAARHLGDAVQAVPNNPIYRYHLGVAYLRSGNVKRAESEFQQALKIDPNFQFAEQTRALLASTRK